MNGSAPRTAESPATPQSRAAQWMRWWAMGAVRGLAWLGRPVASLTAHAGTPLQSAFRDSRLAEPVVDAVEDAVPDAVADTVLASEAARSVVCAGSEPVAARDERRRMMRPAIETTLLPALVARHSAPPQAGPAFELQASQLAQLVLLSHSQAATDLICEVNAIAESLVHVLSSLVEPAARRLGDLWHNDDCTEFDVAVGLYHLQSALRRLSIDHPALIFPRPSVLRSCLPQSCVALLAPQPGEGHVLATALHADLAWQAGWEPQVEFPRTDEALQALLAARRVDLLDLSLSAAFRREHRIERMATTVARARCASLNPNLVVVVSGRLFHDCGDAARLVGADASCRSALHFRHLLAQTAWMGQT